MPRPYEKNLVSVITPAFRAGNYISETILSTIKQTYSQWEMWIVDDFAPDDTCQKVEAFTIRDKRVRLIRQPHNEGPASARNAGLAAAQGQFIAFLDADDLWLPQKLERQLGFMRQTKAMLSFTEYRRIDAHGQRYGRQIQVPDRLNYRQLLRNTAIATSTVVVDRNLVGDFRMKPVYYDDYSCWLAIVRGGGYAHGLHEDLMRYRVRQQSMSRRKLRSALEVWRVYRQVEDLGFIDSARCFANYAIRGWWKYREF